MALEKKFTETLWVRIDPELLNQIKKKAEGLNTDVSTIVRWYVRAGLYLEELNVFIHSRKLENQ